MSARSYTSRELEVARSLAEGLRNKQIAHALGISEATTKAHVAAFAKKSGLAPCGRVAVALANPRLCDDDERDRVIGCPAPIKFAMGAA